MYRRTGVSMVLIGLVLGLAACSSQPTKEVAAVESTMDQAVVAEAEAYATDAYQSSRETFEEAQAGIRAENEKFAISIEVEQAVARKGRRS